MATEYATFESFYVESSAVGWVLAGAFALLAGLAIFFSWGAATPVVATIGTWVGTMAGYSGIAATNYGLALIGFGSIATGGLGIIGGAAIITVALTFSTEVVIDYTLGNIVSTYNQSKFIEDSKNMVTLPIPQNEDGSNNYEIVVLKLKKEIDTTKPLSLEYNQQVLLESFKTYPENIDDSIKDFTLKSYLNFVTNNYVAAKKYASDAINIARQKEKRRTLPAFIYATSSLYDDQFDFKKVNDDYFRYSILAEPDNELIPLMFSIYLDRIMYRMNDDTSLNYKTLDSIRDIAFEIRDDDIKKQSLVIVLMRYFIKVKIEQQKILALTETKNLTIKTNKKTLAVVKQSFIEYKNLLNSLELILIYNPIQKHIRENQDLENLNVINAKYEESQHFLKKVIDDLEEYQRKAEIQKEQEEKSWWKFWE